MTVGPAATAERPPGFGVYLHVPFCAHRCDYCAFATWTDRDHQMVEYVDAVVTEIARSRADGQLRPADTVFVGGGTPSLLAPTDLARLIAAVETAPGAEVTVECNPESMTESLVDELAAVGVTRISIGVQSLRPHVLAGLGRRNVEGAVQRAVGLIERGGFSTWNADLVYGGAGERDEDWLATLEGVVALGAPHVSAYALTIEPGTALASAPDRHPDDDVQADRYEALDRVLGAAGYEWYELSNFARPGHACRHNSDCWQQSDYLGFGCAAHSHLGGRRFANVWNLDRYVARIREGRSPVASEERLDARGRAREALELALRTRRGVPVEAISDEDQERLASLLERVGDKFVLTTRGRLLANEVSAHLMSGTESTQSTADSGEFVR